MPSPITKVMTYKELLTQEESRTHKRHPKLKFFYFEHTG